MAIELKVPQVGESIAEVEIGGWLKNPGDLVKRDEPVVTLESEKATVELPSPDSGTITQILKQKGDVAKVGETIAYLEPDSRSSVAEAKAAHEQTAAKEPKPVVKPVEPRVMPAAQIALAEHNLRPEEVKGTGPGGRILKEDVLRHVEQTSRELVPESKSQPAPSTEPTAQVSSDREEEVVPMSRLRR